MYSEVFNPQWDFNFVSIGLCFVEVLVVKNNFNPLLIMLVQCAACQSFTPNEEEPRKGKVYLLNRCPGPYESVRVQL